MAPNNHPGLTKALTEILREDDALDMLSFRFVRCPVFSHGYKTSQVAYYIVMAYVVMATKHRRSVVEDSKRIEIPNESMITYAKTCSFLQRVVAVFVGYACY